MYSEYGKESMGDVLWGHALNTKVLMEKGWGLGESEYAQKHHLQQVKLFTAIVAFSQKNPDFSYVPLFPSMTRPRPPPPPRR